MAAATTDGLLTPVQCAKVIGGGTQPQRIYGLLKGGKVKNYREGEGVALVDEAEVRSVLSGGSTGGKRAKKTSGKSAANSGPRARDVAIWGAGERKLTVARITAVDDLLTMLVAAGKEDDPFPWRVETMADLISRGKIVLPTTKALLTLVFANHRVRSKGDTGDVKMIEALEYTLAKLKGAGDNGSANSH